MQNVPPEEEIDAHDIMAKIECGDCVHMLGSVDNIPVCTLRMRYIVDDNDHRIAKFERMAVDSQYRGIGYGQQLIKAMELVSRERGCRRAMLSAQTHAIPFYEKLGFETHGDVFMDANIPHKKMHKDLFLSSSSSKALIFDCDGVLVDSEPFSCAAWRLMMQRKFGVDVGDDCSEILGTTSLWSAEYFCKRANIPYDHALLQTIAIEKEHVYFELAAGHLKLKPGVLECIRAARERGYRVGVGSSGAQTKIRWSFNEATPSLSTDLFDAITGGEDKRGKPHPDIFLAAAAALDVSPSNCTVIEDTTAGVRAARSAGMSVVALIGTMSAAELVNAGANYTVDILTDVKL